MSDVKGQNLNFENVAFAVSQLIVNCPPSTVVRELLQNAIDSATSKPGKPGEISWFIEEMNWNDKSVKKIGLYNEGPGMTGEDLNRLMDLASTNKQLGINENYGQGGKISSLKVSPAGVIYRSCKHGSVSEIILCSEHHQGCDFPVYVKKRREVEGSWETVIDVTEFYFDRSDRDLSKEWTEVVLMGSSPEQDTVESLYPHPLSQNPRNWLMRAINTRFFRFPPGVMVGNAAITDHERFLRNAHGLEKTLAVHCDPTKGGMSEDVPVIHPLFGPIKVRYIKLKGETQNRDNVVNSRTTTLHVNGLGSRGDHACVVYRDECYDFRSQWSRISGAFGVTFGSSNIAIQIFLPPDAPVKNNIYRNFILSKETELPIEVTMFADVARENRPAWLVAYVESEGNRTSSIDDDVNKLLRKFYQDMHVTPGEKPRVQPGAGDDHGEVGHREGDGRREPDPNKDPKDPAKPKKHWVNSKHTHPAVGKRIVTQSASGAPSVCFTEDAGLLKEMAGRAGLYRREENCVFLSRYHFRYLDDLKIICEEAGDDADRRILAINEFEKQYCFTAGRYVITAWLFRGRSEWDNRAWDEAISMGSLTVTLASPESLRNAQRNYRRRISGQTDIAETAANRGET